MLKILAVAALLLGAPAAYSQTVSSCPTATPGTVWSKGEWLPCSTTVVYIAEPVPATAPVSDMRCPIAPATGVCVFSWQLGPKVLPTDQVWVETTAKPTGTWDEASRLKFASAPLLDCTTLVYQGAPITTVTPMSGYLGPGTTVTPVIGIITLSSPLPAGVTNYVPQAVFFDFSTSYVSLSGTPGEGLWNTTAQFSTDSAGNITAWSFGVSSHPSAITWYSIGSTQSGDTESLESIDGGPQQWWWTATNAAPGTWSCPLAQYAALQAQINALNAEIAKLEAAK
jgi:hypothetical protein